MLGSVEQRSEGGWEGLFPRPGDASNGPGRVGVYDTAEEAQRVVDLLRIKQALDAGTSLELVPLHQSLQEYAGNESTMQYLRDTDPGTVWSTFHACGGAEQLEAAPAVLPPPPPPPAAAAVPPVALAAGAVMGRHWWERLSSEEQEEQEQQQPGGDGMRADAEVQHVTRAGSEAGDGEVSGSRSNGYSDEGEGEGGSAEQATLGTTPSGRPLRAAALRRKQPAPAPAELDCGDPEARRRRSEAAAAAHVRRRVQAEREAHEAAQEHYEAQYASRLEEHQHEQHYEPRQQQQQRQFEAEGDDTQEYAAPQRPRKVIIFPPVPASMRCNQCVNCQNPQRKRPCVLARRRLLDLLREQEAATVAAAGEEGGEGGEGGGSEGAADVAAGDYGGGGSLGSPTVAVAAAAAAAAAAAGEPPALPPMSPAAAIRSSLNLPGRKQLYPIIPPTQRCGACKPCLNPKLKKACLEARRRQLEAGLVPGIYAQALAGSGAAGPTSPTVPASPTAATAAAALAGGYRPRTAPGARTAAVAAAGAQLGFALLGCRVRVFWPAMRRWYEGFISSFDKKTGQHHIEYDDGDKQDHLLAEEKYVLLDPPRQLPPRQRSPGEGEGEQDAQAGEAAGASTPVGPAAAAAAEAVARLPTSLAACCRRGSDTAAAAAAAGLTASLVGRFVAAFSCRLSVAQRQEHAAFLVPLLEAECFEGVQACLEEAILLCKPQDPTTTFGTAPAALPSLAARGSERAPHSEQDHGHAVQQQHHHHHQRQHQRQQSPGSVAGTAPGGGASCSGSRSGIHTGGGGDDEAGGIATMVA
ncbi:DNA mismatch repair Msh6-1 [Micractinium conductrix]|uniref:DNA mismatch repair Msh6-1 n=1 Tax=Micractinium conductrix TaxID=554055 RepID=A0A2P6VA92_9CHLO|nr:DNA mismatch repair Msh6-1 [Micractinium conductrix]|eukprot:PSC70995.1 DNA mismatch repair Msh6-1 [Micractinium conductrix]